MDRPLKQREMTIPVSESSNARSAPSPVAITFEFCSAIRIASSNVRSQISRNSAFDTGTGWRSELCVAETLEQFVDALTFQRNGVFGRAVSVVWPQDLAPASTR